MGTAWYLKLLNSAIHHDGIRLFSTCDFSWVVFNPFAPIVHGIRIRFHLAEGKTISVVSHVRSLNFLIKLLLLLLVVFFHFLLRALSLSPFWRYCKKLQRISFGWTEKSWIMINLPSKISFWVEMFKTKTVSWIVYYIIEIIFIVAWKMNELMATHR